MQLNELKPRTTRYKYPRVGRGGKRGKTAGKGTKGQKARAGRKMRPELRDIIKKFPKLRGYRFSSIHAKAANVNVGDLEVFSANAEVNPTALILMKLIRRQHGAIPTVKILGGGELGKALKVSMCLVSASAKAAIEKAGGTITPIPEKVSPQAAQNAKAATAVKSEKPAKPEKAEKAEKPAKEPKAPKAKKESK
jgi:large subunit ribosomal protein L15